MEKFEGSKVLYGYTGKLQKMGHVTEILNVKCNIVTQCGCGFAGISKACYGVTENFYVSGKVTQKFTKFPKFYVTL